MSVLRHLVFATSTALVASTVLATGALAAPLPSTADVSAQAPVSAGTNQDLLNTLTKSLAAADVTPAKSAKSLETQIFALDTALRDAEAAALEAAGNLVASQEATAQDRVSPNSLGGTSLVNFAISSAETTRQQDALFSRTAQGLYDQADKELSTKRSELIAASAKARNTSVKTETARLAKASETRSEAELMAALQNSHDNVAEPINDPALDPEITTVATGALGTASIGGASVQIPTAISRTTRIDRSVTWAKKIAYNNKYKYRYGATGPTYFDCSGYTGKAFAAGGKALQRTSSSQYKAAPKKVKLSSLQKGDLVFWSSNGGRSFYHVALYLGGGNIAHARNPKAGISVTKLNYAGMANIYKYAGRY